MNGELSHGLPRLVTHGNRIVNSQSGEAKILRGVNRSGLEYTEPDEEGFCGNAGLSHYEIRWLAGEWKCGILRLPVNQDFALRGRGVHGGEVYLRDIDRVISWGARYGCYTLIDLQWLDADSPFGPNRQFVPPLPNSDTPRFWETLARRYRDEPAVLFDIFNEPHDREPQDPFPVWRPDGTQYPATHRRVSMDEWKPWARKLIDTIRAEAPEALIFVSGPTGVTICAACRSIARTSSTLPTSTRTRARNGSSASARFRARIRCSRGSGAARITRSIGGGACRRTSIRLASAGPRGAGRTGPT